jgi:hypothetical protein
VITLGDAETIVKNNPEVGAPGPVDPYGKKIISRKFYWKYFIEYEYVILIFS